MRRIEVPKVFVDETSARIIIAALYRPRTALEICKVSGVPVADVFSRIKVLEKKGLLRGVGTKMNTEGKEVPSYQAMLNNAYVFLDKGTLKARFQLVSCGQEELSVDGSSFI